MTHDEIVRAVAQAHFDAYAAAIKAGKTPTQAMQIADAAANAERLALNERSGVKEQAGQTHP